MPVSGCGGHAEGFPGLVHGQTREVTQLDEPCGRPILAPQLGEAVVEGQELVRRGLRSQINGIDVESLAAPASLLGEFFPCAIDQDAAHRLSSGGEKVPPAVPALLMAPSRIATRQKARIRLMDQCCRLERLPGLLLSELLSGQPAQLVIDQRQELLGGTGLALPNGGQDAGDFSHR